ATKSVPAPLLSNRVLLRRAAIRGLSDDGHAVIVVETAPATAEAKEEKTPAPAPLLIEWRGDRYVRFNGSQQNASLVGEQRGQPDYVEEFGVGGAHVARAHKSLRNKEASEITSAVLVIRDGRREEVSSYTIVSG